MEILQMVKNTQKSWVKEATKPIIGVVVCGLITAFMLFLSIKAFMQYDEMEPMRENAIVVTDGKILPENEGKLIFVSGRVTIGECTVSDPDFDVTVKAPYLLRIVEMRQWRKSSTNRNMADLVIWSSQLQPRHQEIGGEWYTNPDRIPFDEAVFHADTPFMLGEFELSPKLLEKFLKLPDRRTRITGLKQSGADKNGLVLDDDNNWYFYKSDFGPVIGDAFGTAFFDIGDTRVYFQMVDPAKLGEITIMAKQENGKLTQYQEGISYIEHLYDGIMSKDEVLIAEKSFDSGGTITAVCMTLIPAGIAVFFVWRIFKIKKKYKR
jgi:hypothetical protein